MRVDDRINKTIIFIGRADNGQFVPYGTGFIVVSMADKERGWQTVVTARHVIEQIQCPNVYVRINTNSDEASIIELPKRDWLFHPDEYGNCCCASNLGGNRSDRTTNIKRKKASKFEGVNAVRIS